MSTKSILSTKTYEELPRSALDEGTMEIAIFLRLLLKRWWIILLGLTLTVSGTLIFSENQVPVYSSSATYVLSPSPTILEGTGFLSGLSVLGGQPTVASTYAVIASSSVIKQNASDALGLTPAQAKSMTVSSRVQTGTNVIEISVEGTNPLLIQAFTSKIGECTIIYIDKLNGVFTLQLLDGAVSPAEPIRPNKRLNLIVGTALGLVLGVGIAFLMGLNVY